VSHIAFNPPPGWPEPPPGWMPPMGWAAPVDWPEPPTDWVLFLESPSSEPVGRAQNGGTRMGAEGATGEAANWWGETGAGYHSAYFASPSMPGARLSRRILFPPRGNTVTPSGEPSRRRWWRRSLIGFAVASALLIMLPLANNPLAQALNECEDAVHLRASEEQANLASSANVVGGLPDDPLALSRRAEMRYTLVESGDADVTRIAGDYQTQSGEWWTFTCAVLRSSDPPRVVEVTLTPVAPAGPQQGSGGWQRVP
jgi:hypothetical protein